MSRQRIDTLIWAAAAALAFLSFWLGWWTLVPAIAGLTYVYFREWKQRHNTREQLPLLGVLYPPDDNDKGGK